MMETDCFKIENLNKSLDKGSFVYGMWFVAVSFLSLRVVSRSITAGCYFY